MNISLHPIIIFFWAYILWVRVQCRGSRGIPNESKLSEHKQLCFKRCDIGFQADDKEKSSKEIFGRRSCYEKCLSEDGDAKSVKSEWRVSVDEQKTSLLKRIRRNALNTTDEPNTGVEYGLKCLNGMLNADNKTGARMVHGIKTNIQEIEGTGRYQKSTTWKIGGDKIANDIQTVFHEIKDTGRYQGTVTWKPHKIGGKLTLKVSKDLHGIEDTERYPWTVTWKPDEGWDAYKIIAVYNLGKPNLGIECKTVPKTERQYNITNSSNGIMKDSRVDVLVVPSPHFERLNGLFSDYQLACYVPAVNGCYLNVDPAVVKTSSTAADRTPSPTGLQTNSITRGPATTKPSTTWKYGLQTNSITRGSATTKPSTTWKYGLQNNSTSRGPATTEPSYTRKYDIWTDRILVAGFIALCALLVALVSLAFVCYRRHKKHERTKLVNPLTELEFEFDAFIIYSSKDSEWVVKTLLPTLEGKHGLKCCVHYRDFTLGIPIRKNMVDSVYKCKKTVAVVSANFFNSNYCGSELDYALHRLMEKNDNSLVVIKLDDVDRNKLPKELQNRSYIDYPKSIEKETWEKKLIKCLKVNS